MLFLLSFVVRGYGVGLGVNLLLYFHILFKHNVVYVRSFIAFIKVFLSNMMLVCRVFDEC